MYFGAKIIRQYNRWQFTQHRKTSGHSQLSRKVAISWLPVLSHHRAYRSVHGGLLEKFHLVFSLPIVIVGKAYIP